MKITRMVVPVLFVLLNLPCAYAQEKPAGEAPAAEPFVLQIPLKVQVVLTEYDGAKKISSMPYTMSLIVSHYGHRESLAQLRVGVRVPVTAGVTNQKTGENGAQFQYIDVGTNIDCYAWRWSDDRYFLSGTVDRSSVYTMSSANEPKEWEPGDPNFGNNPIIRQTRGVFDIALRDGQTGEATVATDPITGHVLKVEVTLNVVK